MGEGRKVTFGEQLFGTQIDARRLLAPMVRWLVVLGLVIILSLLNDFFLTWNNMINVLRQATILGIVGLGLTSVLITGGIDLSVGGVMALVGCLTAQLLRSGMPIPLAILFGLGTAALVGSITGCLVGIVKLPAFVATYGMFWITEGIAMILMQGAIIFGLPRSFRWIGIGHVGAIPAQVILAVILIIATHLLLQKTTIGREVFAVGANPDAAHYSGINTRKTLISVYVLSALMAGVAGLIMTARLDAAQAGMGQPFVLQGIATVVMGGTSRRGGVGGIPGTVVGALILTLVVNGMNLLGVSSLAQSLVIGLVILLAVFLDQAMKKWTE